MAKTWLATQLNARTSNACRMCSIPENSMGISGMREIQPNKPARTAISEMMYLRSNPAQKMSKPAEQK